MFERMLFVANRRNRKASLHFVLLIHHCDSRLLDFFSRRIETKAISKRSFKPIYAQWQITDGQPLELDVAPATDDRQDKRGSAQALLARYARKEKHNETLYQARHARHTHSRSIGSRTWDSAGAHARSATRHGCAAGSSPRERYARCCPYQPSTGPTVTPTATAAIGAARRRRLRNRATGSGSDLRCGKDKASQGERRADKPLQQGGFKRSQVILRRQMKQPSLNARQAFADISQHMF